MSDSLERTVEELRAQIARLEARIGILERREVRVGGSLAKLSGFDRGRKADVTTDEMPAVKVLPSPPPAPVSARAVPPPGPTAAPSATPPPPPTGTPNSAAASATTGTPPPPLFSLADSAPAAASPVSPPVAPPMMRTQTPPPRSAPVAREGEDLESRMGLTWINRIGALTLILAAGFIFKYAADNGWIGPWARVLTGMACGAAALAAGEFLVRRGHRVVAQGVAGLGIAIFYLSLFASFSIFQLLPQLVVFALMAMVTVLGGWLSVRYESQALAALAIVGGFLTPLMLSTGENRPWALLSYLTILAAGGVALAMRQRWQGLAWVAYIGTKVLYWVCLIDDSGATAGYPGLVFGAIFYVLFLLTPWRGIAAVAQISFAFAVLTADGLSGSDMWTWELLVPVLASIGVSSYRKRTVEAVAAMLTAHFLAGFALLLMQDSWSQVLIPKDSVGFGVLAVIWMLFAGWAIVGWLHLPSRSSDTVAALLALNSVAFAGEGLALIHLAKWELAAPFAFALAAIHLALSLPSIGSLVESEGFAAVQRVSLVLGVLFVACAIPLQFDGAVVSVLWAGLAAALAWLSVRDQAVWKQIFAFLLFLAAVLRLIAVDLPDLPGDAKAYANTVFLTAVFVAGAMFFAAWAWRSLLQGWLMAFAGHFMLLFTLIVEALRLAETVSDRLLFSTTAVSVIVGTYAAILVAIGVLTRTRPNRIAGLLLLSIVVAKLYFFDVWLLDTFFRIVAFGVLGTMLLATSFLYSKLKNTVRQLLSDEPEPGGTQPVAAAGVPPPPEAPTTGQPAPQPSAPPTPPPAPPAG